ncbi:MAG: DMT family transporter [Actinobacteria bacterium]|nr:DMT family transporter [Actinomycetota bacterium]
MGAAAVLVAVSGWSFTNTLIKVSSQPALAFALYRLWLGSVLLLAVLTLAGRRLTRPVIRASAPGGALLGVEIAFFFSALKHTSIADVTVISALQPALTLLVAGRLFGERVTRREVAWTLVSVAGVGVVAIGSSGTPAWSLRGDVLAAGSLIAWTAYFLVSKHARSTVPALEYMTVVTITAALVITPLALVSGQPLGGLQASDALWLALFVVGASGGHLLVAWAHPLVDVSVSSLLMLAQPVLASLAALLVLGEPLTPPVIAGGLVVIGSLAAIVTHAARVGGGPELAPSETPQL